jgi:DNA-binding transcriptional LysR family regulator
MESRFSHDLVHSVLSAELDLAILEEPLENPLLTLVALSTMPLHALMSADHPAAKKGRVEVTDFANVGWMMFPKRANPTIYERVLDVSKQAGVAPVELHHYMAPQEVIHLIAENFGVAFMPKGIAEQMAGTEIVARPFAARSLETTSYLALKADQALVLSTSLVERSSSGSRQTVSSPRPPDNCSSICSAMVARSHITSFRIGIVQIRNGIGRE